MALPPGAATGRPSDHARGPPPGPQSRSRLATTPPPPRARRPLSRPPQGWYIPLDSFGGARRPSAYEALHPAPTFVSVLAVFTVARFCPASTIPPLAQRTISNI